MSLSPDETAPPGEMKRSVLVVDDEPTLRLGFSYALSNRNSTVDTASTGRQALDKIRTSHYDIVILDLRMPDVDGLGVIETLRLSGNLVPIVLCSAAITPSAALRAIQHRVPDFLLKPVRPADLREVVDFVLNPPDTCVSRALKAAREGRIDTAIREIRADAGNDHICHAWLEVFESMTNLSPDDPGPAASEHIIRSTLAALSFRSTK